MSRPERHPIDVESEPRNSGAHHPPAHEGPYFVHRNKLRTYEYTAAAATLGHEFVAAACEAVRTQKYEAEVLLRTWIDNYVIRLDELLDALQLFIDEDRASTRNPARFDAQEWKRFEAWLQERLQALPLAPRTRDKALISMNKVLTILHRAGVVGARLELDTQRRRKISRVGHSRFTERGLNHKPAPMHIDSPFAFFVEKHGREYDYTSFREVGRLFVIHTTAALRTYYHAWSSERAKGIHEAWMSVLRFLQSRRETPSLRAFFQTLESESYRALRAEAWEEILYGWREGLAAQIEAGERKAITHHETISKLNAVWGLLADGGLVPPVRVRGFKNANSRFLSQSRSTLAQLSHRDATTDAAVRSATNRLAAFFDDSDQSEVREYLRSLSQMLTPEVVRGLPVEGVIEEIHALNSARLVALRRRAECDFRKWHDHWCKGQAAYRDSRLDGREIIAQIEGPTLLISEIRRNSARLLFDAPDDARLGHALRYIDARYGGVISAIHGRIHHLSRSFGGKPALTAYLHAHEHATLALWVMMMVDTGANCEVARTTPWDCLQPSKRLGARKLVLGQKHRAGGAFIVDELLEETGDGTLSLVRAIEMYKAMALRYHALAASEDASCLFLREYKGRIGLLTEWSARGWFLGFLARHPELERLNARPSMIRPSVLMDVQHRNGNWVDAAQAIADHASPSTTLQHYTGRAPIKLRYSLAMREFQNRFQSVIIVSIDGAAAKLGLTDEQFASLFSEAARTGLGVVCLNPLAGAQPGTRPGEYCTRFDACCNCSMRWVVATPDNIADLMLFREHLEASRNAGASTAMVHWDDKWLPWLIFTEVVLHKLREGECAGLHEQAARLADERRACYVRIPLE